MKNKINSLNTLLSAFESRNEKLHEEIKKNEEAIASMKAELNFLLENDEELMADSKKNVIIYDMKTVA